MGFIKVVKRRATRFDNLAKKWKGPFSLPKTGAGACFPGNFEILQLQRCVFLHSEAADTVLQLPRKDNLTRQFTCDLIPISTTQILSRHFRCSFMERSSLCNALWGNSCF